MSAIWDRGALPAFDALCKDAETEVLIIGGGAAGLLTAYYLRENAVPCMLVERDRICSGVTGNTTAKITAQHGFCYQKLIRKGVEPARKYLQANLEALEAYDALSKKFPCDFEKRDNYVYSKTDWSRVEKELAALDQLRYPADLAQTDGIPVKTAGAVRFRDQAQLNPLKFFGALAKDLPIYENTPVLELKGMTAVTAGGEIRAKKIVVATHFPFLNKHGSYFLKLYQFRSYMLALGDGPDVGGMYVDGEQGGLSFRNYGKYLLLGGCGARTGKPCGGWEALEGFARRHYPASPPVTAWATQDCMSLDGVPYIGQYSSRTPDLFVAAGFNKWGMTGSMVAARLLCDQILGKRNDLADVFSPSRSILHPQLAVNCGETVSDFLRITPRRCPHLGCPLQWNKAERSWDCPCHGSRFSQEGKLLDNPANGNLPPKRPGRN